MNKKWSSFPKQQALTESFRNWVSERQATEEEMFARMSPDLKERLVTALGADLPKFEKILNSLNHALDNEINYDKEDSLGISKVDIAEFVKYVEEKTKPENMPVNLRAGEGVSWQHHRHLQGNDPGWGSYFHYDREGKFYEPQPDFWKNQDITEQIQGLIRDLNRIKSRIEYAKANKETPGKGRADEE